MTENQLPPLGGMEMEKRLWCVSILSLLLLALVISCASIGIGVVGTLPRKWWEKDRGIIEAALKEASTGEYQNILAFVGKSDSETSFNEQMAIKNANQNAKTLLSDYLITKYIGAIESQTDSIVDVLSEDDKKQVITKVEIIQKEISYNLSISQFSSFIQEAYHTEKVISANGIAYYKGWVCCTIPDSVIEETRRIAQAAFDSVVDTTAAYAPVMNQIQETASLVVGEKIAKDMGR